MESQNCPSRVLFLQLRTVTQFPWQEHSNEPKPFPGSLPSPGTERCLLSGSQGLTAADTPRWRVSSCSGPALPGGTDCHAASTQRVRGPGRARIHIPLAAHLSMALGPWPCPPLPKMPPALCTKTSLPPPLFFWWPPTSQQYVSLFPQAYTLNSNHVMPRETWAHGPRPGSSLSVAASTGRWTVWVLGWSM